MRDFDDLECDPLYLTFRPFHPLGWAMPNSGLPLAMRSSMVERASSLCVDGQMKEYCWVDPNRDDLLVSFERAPRQWRGDRTFRYAVSYRADLAIRLDSRALGLPPSLRRPGFRVPGHNAGGQRTTAGRRFLHRFSTRMRSFSTSPPASSSSSPRTVRGPLHHRSNRSLRRGPEGLGCRGAHGDRAVADQGCDRLLSNRSPAKLPIEPDRAAFSKAGLNLDVECQCDVKEMTLREQLRWLSAAAPEPTRLVEKKGELILTPASSSKSGK